VSSIYFAECRIPPDMLRTFLASLIEHDKWVGGLHLESCPSMGELSFGALPDALRRGLRAENLSLVSIDACELTTAGFAAVCDAAAGNGHLRVLCLDEACFGRYGGGVGVGGSVLHDSLRGLLHSDTSGLKELTIATIWFKPTDVSALTNLLSLLRVNEEAGGADD
jgi:hypothetical protein